MFDTNGNGKISSDEIPGIARLIALLNRSVEDEMPPRQR